MHGIVFLGCVVFRHPFQRGDSLNVLQQGFYVKMSLKILVFVSFHAFTVLLALF
jgi:hypothetical protein